MQAASSAARTRGPASANPHAADARNADKLAMVVMMVMVVVVVVIIQEAAVMVMVMMMVMVLGKADAVILRTACRILAAGGGIGVEVGDGIRDRLEQIGIGRGAQRRHRIGCRRDCGEIGRAHV